MPKKAYLAPHFSSNELKQKYRNSKDLVESRRWHLLWKVSLGWTVKNSAIVVGYSYPYAKSILNRYNQNGAAGVENHKNKTSKHARGKKRLLSEQQLEKLTRAIEKKPPDGGIWTGTKVARWIEKETGVEKVWNQRGWDYLKKCSYSWQRPRPAHKKANKVEQEIFKPTSISTTNEIHLKSLGKSDAIKKKNEYELERMRMREKSLKRDR